MDGVSLWGLVISGTVALGSVLGIVLTNIGKRGDQEQQQVTDQFKRMLDEVGYWQDTTSRTRTEWEGRWDRQMKRCRTITDQLVAFIAAIAHNSLDPLIRAEAEDLTNAVRAHNDGDHDRQNAE